MTMAHVHRMNLKTASYTTTGLVTGLKTWYEKLKETPKIS